MSPTVSPAAPVSVVVSVVACSMTVIVLPPRSWPEPSCPEPDAHALTATRRTRIPPSGRTVLRTRFVAFLLGVGGGACLADAPPARQGLGPCGATATTRFAPTPERSGREDGRGRGPSSHPPRPSPSARRERSGGPADGQA